MEINIIGHHITKFGEHWDRDAKDLMQEAVLESVRQAGIDPGEIEAVFVANKAGGSFHGQRHLNALASQLFEHHPPSMRIEGACASGGLAVLAAEYALLSGQYQTVMVVGVEKMTDVSASETTRILASAADAQTEYGSTFPGLYAILAQQHMLTYGTTREQLSAVAVKNHAHALNNPKAQFHKSFTLEQVSNSQLVADPLRVLDCSPISDGAAAVILSRQPVKGRAQIIGFGHGQDSLDLAGRASLTSLAATKRAADQAYTQAGMSPQQIQAAEVHDCFTIAEILAAEDLGFARPGETANHTPKKPIINHSGGLKACGHPVGATGVKQIAYLAHLLETQQYQTGLTHNVGGSGATAVVHILKGTK
jgi:acetyl-CoA C-acetyltransferase